MRERSEFSRWLDEELVKRGWSDLELARRARLDAMVVLKARYGPPPNAQVCTSVAAALGVPLETALLKAGLPLPEPPPPRLLLPGWAPPWAQEAARRADELRGGIRVTPNLVRLPIFHALLSFGLLAGLPHDEPLSIPTALGAAAAAIVYIQLLAYRGGWRLRA